MTICLLLVNKEEVPTTKKGNKGITLHTWGKGRFGLDYMREVELTP
jgi:hypothetical protein